MFCSSCGTTSFVHLVESHATLKLDNKNVPSSSKESTESQTESSSSRPTTSFKSFMSKKQEERASHFRPSKKPRVACKQEVTINIGIMELNEKEEGVPLRGKSLPLKIGKESDYDRSSAEETSRLRQDGRS